VGALAPPGKVARGRRTWVLNMVTYTLAGALTSVLLGAGLGLVGALALPDDMAVPAGVLGLAVAAVAMAREIGVVAVPLPQLGRQT